MVNREWGDFLIRSYSVIDMDMSGSKFSILNVQLKNAGAFVMKLLN
jgi:hypothetical protein